MKQSKKQGAASAAPCSADIYSVLARRRRNGVLVISTALALLAFVLVAYPSLREYRLSHESSAQLQRENGLRLTDPVLLYYLGRSLNREGRYAEADPFLRNAVGLDPDSARLRAEWAAALLGSGRVTAAFGQLKEFAGVHPQSAPAHLLLGKFYVDQNSMLRAQDELTRAVALDPKLADAWAYLAVAREKLGQPVTALDAARHAAALRPRAAADQLRLGLALSESGQGVQARPAFAQAAKLAPRTAVVHREYARWLLDTGGKPADIAQAEREARLSLALNGQDAETQTLLGRILVRQSRWTEAVAPLTAAARMDSVNPAPALELAQVWQRIGNAAQERLWEREQRRRVQNQQTREALLTAVQNHPERPGPHLRLAGVYAQEGDIEGCLRQHAEAMHRAPDAPQVLTEAANDLTDHGRPALALALARRALSIAPESPTASEAQANALLGLQQFDDAAREYDRILNWWPDKAKEYRRRLVNAYKKSDEYRRSHAQN